MRGTTCKLLICCVLLGGIASARDKNKDTQDNMLLGQAHHAYYNLRSQGLSTVECNITPNWDLLLKDSRKKDPKGTAAAIRMLRQLRFTAALGEDDSVTVTHSDLKDQSQSKELNAVLSQLYTGMEQMTTGFFDSWKIFMLRAPFPTAGSRYRLEDMGNQYRLSYKEGKSEVVTTMDHDFAVDNLQVSTKEFDSALRPSFTHTPKGLRLSGYEAEVTPRNHRDVTHLKALVGYQDLDGLAMVQKVHLIGSYGETPFEIELGFSGCHVTRTPVAEASR